MDFSYARPFNWWLACSEWADNNVSLFGLIGITGSDSPNIPMRVHQDFADLQLPFQGHHASRSQIAEIILPYAAASELPTPS